MTKNSRNQPQPDDSQGSDEDPKGHHRSLTPEAKRALGEADARRKARASKELDAQEEVGGRDGPDPVRHGDWEKNGIASDF